MEHCCANNDHDDNNYRDDNNLTSPKVSEFRTERSLDGENNALTIYSTFERNYGDKTMGKIKNSDVVSKEALLEKSSY